MGFDLFRRTEIEVFAPAVEHFEHPGAGLLGQVKHLPDAVFLLLGEIDLGLVLAADDPGHVVARVADALQLADLAQHGADLILGIVAQVSGTHLAEVLADLVLHVVADLLVFLDPFEEFLEGSLVGRAVEVLDHIGHPHHPLAEDGDFLLGLEHRDFRRLHQTALDVLQTEFLFLLALLRLDDLADELLDLRDEPDQDEGIGHVESGVEHRQGEGKLGRGLRIGRRVEAHDAADHPHEGEEAAEDPDHAEYVEQQVGQGGAAGLRIGRHRGDVGGKRGTDVLTHHQGDTLIDGNGTRSAEHHRDGHQRCR